MSGPEIVTLGCRLNSFESEVMKGLAADLTDTVIVNTCAVTSEAERQARQTIRRLKKQNPSARIVVAGCAAQLHPERFAAMPEVDRVLGNIEKLDASALAGAMGPLAVSDVMENLDTAVRPISGFEGRSRAFVEIQRGCDHRCTFCVVPFARGPNRSLAPTDVLAQVRTMVDAGFKEVVLTGVDASSYGRDRSGLPSLGGLARMILDQCRDLPRLRLTSLDPAAVDDEIFRLLAENDRFMPHLHLSLQAADDTILKRMKRRHDRQIAALVCRRAQEARPGLALGADLIAGFPTESEEMFANTLRAVDEFGLCFLHVFPFSPRHGTPAARMPQVAAEIRKQRAAALRASGDTALARWLEMKVGEETVALVESEGLGRSAHYAAITFPPGPEVGSLVRLRISGAVQGRMIGEPAP